MSEKKDAAKRLCQWADAGWEHEKGLALGRERELVRRALEVLEIAEAGEKVA